jgi:hypothetical protein
VKRLHFIFRVLAAAVCTLALHRKTAVAMRPGTRPQTWAEHIQEITTKTHSRRYEHYIHARVCHGDYDHLHTPAEAAERKARCARICGLCRYINSLPVWPGPNYRRPAASVLEALEHEPYFYTRAS